MAWFRKSAVSAQPTPDAVGPFVFRVDDMLTIGGRGHVFTGSVESGSVVAGASAELVLRDRVVPVRIMGVETKVRRKPEFLDAGESGAIVLDTLDRERTLGDVVQVDGGDVQGAVVRSR